eukprot:COSAG01_NODE_2025_length_8604_cov_16.296296_15_plen_65_part_00
MGMVGRPVGRGRGAAARPRVQQGQAQAPARRGAEPGGGRRGREAAPAAATRTAIQYDTRVALLL